MVAGALSYRQHRPRGRSELRHQDDDRHGRAARRLGGGDAAPGHRPDREEAARSSTRSTTPARSPVPAQAIVYVDLLRHRRGAEVAPRSGSEVRNMMADIRAEFPAGIRGLPVQRRFRRRLRQHLRLHRRRLHPARAARLCRGGAHARCRRWTMPARSRLSARAGPGRLSRILDRPAGRARAGPGRRCCATLAAQNAIAALRRDRGRRRTGAGPGRRPVRHRAEPGGREPARRATVSSA